jgi:hypothetical protein
MKPSSSNRTSPRPEGSRQNGKTRASTVPREAFSSFVRNLAKLESARGNSSKGEVRRG